MPENSRYAATKNFTAPARAPLLRPRAVPTPAGVLEHVLEPGDRLDLLARYYYGDDQQWWRIMDANPDLMCAADVLDDAQVGRRIRIPAP